MKNFYSSKGFTLVELVAVIVLLGITSVGVSSYISSSTQAYVDVVRRDETTQIGRHAVERISRELRNALPGSVRAVDGMVSGVAASCIEFLPVVAASHYLNDLPVGVPNSTDTFQVAAFTFNPIANVQYFATVYALTPANVYSGSDTPGSPVQSLDITNPIGGVTANERTVNLANMNRSFPQDSPQRRVLFTTAPVSFCVQNNQLTRHTGYGFQNTQPLVPGTAALLAENIQLTDGGNVSPFQYAPGVLQRAGLVHLDFRFLVPGNNS